MIKHAKKEEEEKEEVEEEKETVGYMLTRKPGMCVLAKSLQLNMLYQR